MFKFGETKRKSPGVSTIPVINVIFLLLIFFITQGSIKEINPYVNAPFSSSAEAVGTKSLEVTIDEQRIIIGTEIFNETDLASKLAEMKIHEPDRELFLKADAYLDSTRLMEILKLIKQAGFNDVYIVTTRSKI